jgi:hypothetical protein
LSARGDGPLALGYSKLITELNDLIDDIQADVTQFVSDMNSIMRFIPSPIAKGMVFAWNEFLKVYNKILDELQKVLAQPGNPDALFRIGDLWNTAVGQPVGNIQGSASAQGMGADDSWSGSAARAYKDAAEAQARALKPFKESSETIRSALRSLSWGVIAFWTALVSALVAFAAGIAVALGLVASIIGAPAAPVDLGAAALTCLGFVLAAVAALVAMISQTDSTLTSLDGVLTDNSGLIGDPATGQYTWPRFTSKGSWELD